MIISVGKSRRDTKWRTQEMPWEELAVKLGSFLRTKETMREYAAMSKDEQSRAKDIGGFVGGRLEGGRRTGANIRERYLITLDADNAPDDLVDTLDLLWGDVEWVVYSTHSHRPGHTRLRLVFPLDRSVTAEMYPAVARMLAKWIDIEAMDPTTYQPERLMYWPSCPIDAEPVYKWNRGDYLSVDEILRQYGAGDAWKDTTLWPIAEAEKEIIVRESKRQGDPREKPGIIGQFCRVYDVEDAIDKFLPDVYSKCEGMSGRYTYTQGTSSAGAVVYDDGLFLYSNHATDPAGCQLLNAFDLVRVHLYGELDAGQEAQDVTRRPSYKAMCEMAAQDRAVLRQIVDEKDEQVADLLDGGEDEQRSWTDDLVLNSKTGKPEQTIDNTVLLLRNYPGLAGLIGYNQLQHHVYQLHAAPWDGEDDVPFTPRQWTDVDDSQVYRYLEKKFGLNNRANTDSAIRIVADENAYHPVQDYLRGLEWDGVERLDTMLVDYMAADDTPLNRAVTRKWMCGAVARAMRPGCQFEAMLVLTGEQGIGKSRLMKIMSRGWFTDSLTRMDGSKESYEALDGVWIVEVAELAAARRSESEQIKNFVSKREDKYRKAYAKQQGTYLRQCVFYGTTNDKEFLRDRTGARRFWPVEVKGIDHGTLRGLTDDVVDQIWAEAYVRWKAGEVLWVNDPKLAAELEGAQDMFSVQDELVGLIEEFLDTLLPADWYERDIDARRSWFANRMYDLEKGTMRRDKVCIAEIRCEYSGDRRESIGPNDGASRRIAAVMNNMKGWKKAKVSPHIPGYGRQRAYVRAEAEQ